MLKVKKLTEKIALEDVKADGWIDGPCGSDCWAIKSWSGNSNSSRADGCEAHYGWTPESTTWW